MANFELCIPQLGEGIIEAVIMKWKKNIGDSVKEDDIIVEIATDKVDTEIPSPVSGIIKQFLYVEGSSAPIGNTIAIIEIEGADLETQVKSKENTILDSNIQQQEIPYVAENLNVDVKPSGMDYRKYYSPLVKSIALKEKISAEELALIKGSGMGNRLTKLDILLYVQQKGKTPETFIPIQKNDANTHENGDTIVEMDRMRKLIAEHMVHSVQTAPHVSTFVEIEVSAVQKWMKLNKQAVFDREGLKLTVTHVFVHAAAQALKTFPFINASVSGNQITLKKNINLGIATALPDGNLIVPVVKNADKLSILDIMKFSSDLVERARNNKLHPDEIHGGTFTITNLGSFGALTGTPIINQPQVAIMAMGLITKRPVVIETPVGDTIGIRSIMMASLSFDHRIVDGMMGGLFLKKVKELIEGFDENQTI